MIQLGDLDWSPLFEVVSLLFALFLEPDPVQIALGVLTLVFGTGFFVKIICRRRW